RRADDVYGDATAARAQFVNPVEQEILSTRRQIRQQPLSRPCRRLAGIKTSVTQRLWPIGPQIGRDRDSTDDGLGAVLAQGLDLELQHLGLVDFEDNTVRRPG